MSKYHINGKGEARPCDASVRDCVFGGAGEHYRTKKAAQEAYEVKMAEELHPSISKPRETFDPARQTAFSDPAVRSNPVRAASEIAKNAVSYHAKLGALQIIAAREGGTMPDGATLSSTKSEAKELQATHGKMSSEIEYLSSKSPEFGEGVKAALSSSALSE